MYGMYCLHFIEVAHYFLTSPFLYVYSNNLRLLCVDIVLVKEYSGDVSLFPTLPYKDRYMYLEDSSCMSNCIESTPGIHMCNFCWRAAHNNVILESPSCVNVAWNTQSPFQRWPLCPVRMFRSFVFFVYLGLSVICYWLVLMPAWKFGFLFEVHAVCIDSI